MTRQYGWDGRSLAKTLGVLHKALILVTLTSLFLFAPLRGQVESAHARTTAMAPIQELPETGGKILWLDSSRVAMGQGDSFHPHSEE